MPTPNIHTTLNLTAASKALADLANERSRLEKRIETAARERELIAAKPLCKDDVSRLMLGQVSTLAAGVPELLSRVVWQLASRPTKTWNPAHMPLLPDDGATLGRLLVGLMPEAIELGIKRAFATMPEIENAGLPMAERVTALAQLDAQLDADHRALFELKAAAEAAGLNWASGSMFE